MNAPGGHIEPGETPVQAAVRGCIEETGIVPETPVLKGVLDFPFEDGMHLKGYVFTSDKFTGTMYPSDEADPFWCKVSEMPYDRMWEDDRMWLPAGSNNFTGSFNFAGDSMKDSRLYIFDKPKKVLCYGSSSTWGFNWQGGGRLDEETRWPTVMKKYIPECFEVIENGVCGRTIGDYMPVKSPTNGIQSLRRVKNLSECDAVIIMLGNNDTLASPESSVSAIASGLGTMVEIIREQNKNAHIFLASPVPISTNCDDKDMFMTFFESQVNKSKALPQEIKKVAEECGCTFIEAGKYVSCDGTDGIHFSAESNKILAVYMADFLNMENW